MKIHSRYHSNCSLLKTATLGVSQLLCLYAAITGKSYSFSFSYFRLGSDRPFELKLSVHTNHRLSESSRSMPSSSQPLFNCDIKMLAHLKSDVKSFFTYFLKLFSRLSLSLLRPIQVYRAQTVQLR